MANYLLISSRDPYESPDAEQLVQLAEGLKARENRATVFLVQNAVLSARRGARHSGAYRRLAQAGVTVLADAFALRERAVGELTDGVQVGSIEQLVDLLVEPGTKAIWH